MDQTGPFLGVEAKRIQHPVEMALGPAASLDGKAGRLVDDDHVGVAMQDQGLHECRVGRIVARCGFGRRRRIAKRRHPHRLPGLEANARLHPLAVDADLSRSEQLLQPAMGNLRIVPLEPAIETLAGFGGVNIAMADAGHVRTVRVTARPANKPPIESTTDTIT